MEVLLGTLWPGFVCVRPDELLSSWLVRLAHAHLLKVHTFCAVTWPGLNIWNRDVDRIAPPNLLATLSQRTPTTTSRIRETTLASYEGVLYQYHNPRGNTNWILPLGIYHRIRRRYGLLFCPSCLQADGVNPYFRKSWRLALSFVCLNCGVKLHEKCPNCNQPVMFFRQELGHKSAMPNTLISSCFHCGFDLSQASKVLASQELLSTQVEWNRIMMQGWCASVFYPPHYFEVLRQIAKVLNSKMISNPALQQILSLCIDKEDRCELPSLQGPLEQWPLYLRRARLLQAHWLLTEWPIRFITIMKEYRIASTPLLRDFPNAPFWYSSVVVEHLYINNVNRRFAGFWVQ
jgi:hypothetical protein